MRDRLNGRRWGHRYRPAARGFSLVELLAVVAVVSALAGLLMSALGGARGAAQRGECASNIRQLTLANELYAGDHADRYAPGAPGIARSNLVRWHGTRKAASQAFSPEGGAIPSYLDAGRRGDAIGVRGCPSFAPVLDDLAARRAGFERGCGGYGYNNAFVGVSRVQRAEAWVLETDALGARRSQFGHPAGTLMFADAAFAGDELIEYSFAEPVFWPEYPGSRPDPSVHFRHRGEAAVAWLDGHVAHERLAFSWSSGLYRADAGALGIGWFGQGESNDAFSPR